MATTNPIPRKPGPISTPYAGPRDSDPLTEDELSLLLAIPRAARSSPNATLFRLPRGTDPSLGWIDVTCAETYSIVSRLAAQWNSRLSDVLHQRTRGAISTVGPGTTICILAQPPVFSLFHFLAFWSLGCTIQYLSAALDGSIIDTNLALSGCKIVFHHGMSAAWVRERQEGFDGEMIELQENEYAHQLVQIERQKSTKPQPVWPPPRRPTPALILQSSGTTGTPKPLTFSLYFYTIGHKLNCQTHLASANSQKSGPKTVYTHPRLLLNPPYWQSFYRSFFVHLSTATPLAFAPISNPFELSPSEFAGWVDGLNIGGTISCVYLIREILVDDTYTQLLRDMHSISVSGSAIDEQTSELFEKSRLPITNTFGSSEFSRTLYASKAPYNLLRPFRDLTPLLVNPISERHPDGSRDVELWYSASTSPYFAHVAAYGGVPLDIEPFPGEGPHHGEPAVNSRDIFRELVTGPSGETAYMHLGRADERIRLRGGGKNLNASAYEARLRSDLERLGEYGGWRVDVVQVFGSGLPATSLVIQLRPTGAASSLSSPRELGADIIAALVHCVERVNTKMNLGAVRVDPGKRLLVITTEGHVHGPGADRLVDSNENKLYPSLMVTHKHTLRRWANVQVFKLWLDGLDYYDGNCGSKTG